MTIILLSSCRGQIITILENKKTRIKMEKLNISKLDDLKSLENKNEKIKVSFDSNKLYRYDVYNKVKNTSNIIYGTNNHGYTKSECYYERNLEIPCVIGNISFYDIDGNLKYRGKCLYKIISEVDFKKASLEGIYIQELGALKIGVWHEFNNDGAITKTTNYEDDFEFNLKNIFEYMIKSNADIYTNNHFREVKIQRNYEKNTWNIRFCILKTNEVVITEINGKTGEIIHVSKSILRAYI